MRVAVIGAGIAGLAAAWELCGAADIVVFESSRLGGRILTEDFEGRPVDCGPDAFLTRTPAATQLCAELGVDDLVAPAAGRTLVWSGGRARPLPDGLVLGAPRRLAPLVFSGLLGPAGLLRAAADLVLPRRPLPADPTVRQLVAGRFGSQVADRLVDPLVGGIHAGSTAGLSAAATVPQLLGAARGSRSLLLGLRRAPPPAGSGPLFLTPRRGLATLVEALVAKLVGKGVELRSEQVDGLAADGPAVRIAGTGERFDAAIVAAGAATAASWLLPGGSFEVPTASVVLVTLGLPEMDLPAGFNGLLVPAADGWLMTACSFASAKWPHWANPGRTVLRVSAGRYGDDRAVRLDDQQLVERLSGELSRALRRPVQPGTWRVSRWPDSFPQYRPGHGQRVAAFEAEVARRWPSVAVCGSSYHGVGIPACVESGRRAARQIVASAGRIGAR